MAKKPVAIVSEVLPSVPCVETRSGGRWRYESGATATEKGKRTGNPRVGRPQRAPPPLAGQHRLELGVSASGLCKYLKKNPLEYEVEGVEGEGAEGDGGEKSWRSLENELLRKHSLAGLGRRRT